MSNKGGVGVGNSLHAINTSSFSAYSLRGFKTQKLERKVEKEKESHSRNFTGQDVRGSIQLARTPAYSLAAREAGK